MRKYFKIIALFALFNMYGCLNRTISKIDHAWAESADGADSCLNRTISKIDHDNSSRNEIKDDRISENYESSWDTVGMRFMMDDIDDVHSREKNVDTTIKDFRIRYKVLYNDQMVPCHDTLLPNSSIFMNIQYKKEQILYKEFRVSDFPEIIPVEESFQYGLGRFFPLSVSDSTLSFHVGYDIPDTDLGYSIMLTVIKDGTVLTSLIDEGELGEN